MARQRRQPEIIAGRVSSDGSIAAGDGFTATKTGTGGYSVTLTASGFRLVAVTVSPVAGSSAALVSGMTPATSTFTVTTFISNTLAGQDSGFAFIATGVQQ